MRPGILRFSFSWRRWLARVAIASLLVAGITFALGTRATVRASGSYVSSTSWPILFVHGFSSDSSVDCGATWNTAISYLHGYHAFGSTTLHWTGTMVKMGFYSADTNCSASLSGEYSHCSSYYASGLGTNNESIRHLACDFAWYVYDHYSVYGHNVQAVAHSMGGLIVRWAIHGVQAHLSPFPPAMYMQDVVTFSTPHGGVPPGSNIFTCLGCLEGDEMVSGSGFMNDTYNYAQDPQGSGWGTDWTMIGGKAFYQLGCDVISSSEATYMNLGHKSYFTSPCYGHGGYLTDTSDSADAHIYWCDGCGISPSSWHYWGGAPHALRHMLYALDVSSW